MKAARTAKREQVRTCATSCSSSSGPFAQDGSQLASVQAGRIRLWDGRTGGYQGSVLLPSGTNLVTISFLQAGPAW